VLNILLNLLTQRLEKKEINTNKKRIQIMVKKNKNKIEKMLREETPRAYPFMMGTSPVTHLRRVLLKNKSGVLKGNKYK
jgi:hypothetical protein